VVPSGGALKKLEVDANRETDPGDGEVTQMPKGTGEWVGDQLLEWVKPFLKSVVTSDEDREAFVLQDALEEDTEVKQKESW
jgi:hypothetical protein